MFNLARCQCRLIWMYYCVYDATAAGLSSSVQARTTRLPLLAPAAAFSRLNRTQCRRPTDRARYQCCPHRSTLHWYSFCSVLHRLCSPGIAMLYYSLQGAVKQWFCGRVAAIQRRMVQVARREGLHPGRHTGRGEDPPFISFFARTTNPGQEKIPENCARGRR